MNKDLITLMRSKEIVSDNFLPTKKEISKHAEEFANDILEEGFIDKVELLSQAIRLKEAMTVIESKVRSSLPEENFEGFGMKGTYTQGGDIPQYEDDPIYKELKQDLKEREDLLKLALKQKEVIFDAYGNEVPKVSTKPRKSSLRISF